MLTQTACQPLYGRISDLIGRQVKNYLEVKIAMILIPLSERSVGQHDDILYRFSTLWLREGTLSPHC